MNALHNAYLFLLVGIISIKSHGQSKFEDKWVNDTYAQMTDTQRIGQLFMIRAHSNLGSDHTAEVEYLIRTYGVGSLCFFQGTPERQAELTNRYQSLSHLPLLVAMDAEWGLNMRLKDACIAYPRQLMLGAIQDNQLIYRFGRTIAYELRRMGVHINFAPVADVNNNPDNPVINERSFGEDKHNVATKAAMYMKGMQDNGVIACAKHFPGHGDTDVDSHRELPLVNHPMTRLVALELMPFRELSQQGIGSMMVAHLKVPAIEQEAHTPTSISKNAVRHLLREQMGFDGLVFTDGLEMRAYTKFNANGEGEAKAIAAGNDILCLPENVPAAFNAIKRYLAEGRIDPPQLEQSVKRVLRHKYRLGLTMTPSPIELKNLRADLNNDEALNMKRELIQNALTLVKNDDKIIPLNAFNANDIASVSIGNNQLTRFQHALNNVGLLHHYTIGKNIPTAKKQELLAILAQKKVVIVGIHGMKTNPAAHFGITADIPNFIKDLQKVTKVVVCLFGNPYALRYFDDMPSLIVSYNEDTMTQEETVHGLFGTFELKGKLPVSANANYKSGMGAVTKKVERLEWMTSTPEKLGFKSSILNKIDTIAQELINRKAAPGCQILVAKNGKVVYHKAFGHHTYTQDQPVKLTDLYDLASVTKCAATTLCLMKLYDEGKLNIYEKLEKYLPQLRGSNKANLTVRDILIHQAGLLAWIPFYKNTLDTIVIEDKIKISPSKKWFSNLPSNEYPIEVNQNLYLQHSYLDSMKRQLIESPLRESRQYFYSDLGMMLMADVIENLTGQTLDSYVEEHFYRPLGMSRTVFKPKQRFSEQQIVPTEEDDYFRYAQVRGHVHDMAAAMFGGVSGHAGLFSTTTDLAILLQMLLNGGEYGQKHYLNPQTIEFFTSRQGGSTRRGLGWDMKELNSHKKANMSPAASSKTFGHTGFTGNAFYADPSNQLIYIFLSNRTYPDMSNKRLINGEYRERIQSVIYEALGR